MTDFSPEEISVERSKIAKTLLKDYFLGVKKLDPAPTLSFISLILSTLFVSKVFNIFVLNLAYLLNLSFFALIVRDSWFVRKKNPISLAAIIVSIFLTSMLLIDVLKLVDTFSVFMNR